MEHLSTFGLSRDPFANDPQLAFWFESPPAADAARRLSRAAQQNKGLCLVTGEGGVGKTMLVRHVLESLEEEVFEAALLVPVPGVSDGPWILDRFARHLGVEEPAAAQAELLGQIYEQLAIVREDGRHAVLLLDEAQILAEEGLLRNLRGLLNLEYEEKRLLTLVLVGLPTLGEAVAAEPALAERVDLRLRLAPLDEESASRYLTHRIRAADGNPAILESGAVAALVKQAGGSPRRLNGLADAALFEAHLAGRVSATAADVERAAAELGLEGMGAADAASGGVRIPGGSAPSSAGGPPPAAAPAGGSAPGAASTSEAAASGEPAWASRPPAAPPRANGGFEPAGAGSFGAGESDDGFDLHEVVADETDPHLREGSPPPPRGAAEETVAFLDAPVADPQRYGPAPAEAIAFPDDERGPGASDGELDDLFADIVED